MQVIDRTLAHRELITKHNTMSWMSDLGRVSVRKDHGKYVVRFEDFSFDKLVKKEFATMPGALVCAETLKEYSL